MRRLFQKKIKEEGGGDTEGSDGENEKKTKTKEMSMEMEKGTAVLGTEGGVSSRLWNSFSG